MIFQTATPNTVNYLIAGYAVILSVIAIYLVSLYLRQRSMRQDMHLFEEMEKEEKAR
jgi:hypothetical protein